MSNYKVCLFIALLPCLLFFGGCSAKENEKSKTPPQTNKQKKQEGEQIIQEILLPKEYFNVIVTVDGKKIINNPENIMAVVNKEYSLKEDYKPTDLVIPNVDFSFGKLDVEKAYMRKEASKNLEEMFTVAKLEDLQLSVVSAYRSYNRQKEIFEASVSSRGLVYTEQFIANPGTSEHQTGLAVDISSSSNGFELENSFANTNEGRWLKENAHLFGFILRYPDGKTNITGYNFEPWHFRYVGKKIAQDIFLRDLTLDEYVTNAKAQ